MENIQIEELKVFTSTVKMELKNNNNEFPFSTVIQKMTNNINSEDNTHIIIIETNNVKVAKNGYEEEKKSKRCFNNAIEVTILGFNNKKYRVKFFTSKKITLQLAGSIEPDFKDAIDVFSKLIIYFNQFCLCEAFNEPITIGEIDIKMMNFKFKFTIEENKLTDMRILSEILAKEDKVEGLCGPNEINILFVRHLISFRYKGELQKSSLVKIFPSKNIIKVNILGCKSHKSANDIYLFTYNIFNDFYNIITYNVPLTDKELEKLN